MYPFLKTLTNFSFKSSKSLYALSSFGSQRFHSAANEWSIRPLKPLEFRNLLKNWAVKEGWNPGNHEDLPFYIADLNGHKGLFLDKKLIASLSAVRYAKDFAYLGLYIVDPNYREQGIGQILATCTLDQLSDCSLMGINAVQSQVGNYQRKYGFIPSHTNSRWSGHFKFQEHKFLSKTDIKIVGKEDLDINQLIDYDASIFSVPREAFLHKWIEMPESHFLAAIQNEKICGYGVISKCLQGYKLAPLFANNDEIAKKLYMSFDFFLKEKPMIQLDTPDNNQSAVKLAQQFGLYKTLQTTRMYKGEETLIKEQDDKNSHVYSLTTLEIG